jgi:hypothetical protein
VALSFAPTCGARLPSRLGALLPASHGGAVAGPARRATAYESWCSATGPSRHSVRLLPPCLGTWPLPPCPITQPSPSRFLQVHDESVCFKCFRVMLQVFCMDDVAKVDQVVAHVAIYCTRML